MSNPLSLAQFLHAQRDAIVARFVDDVRRRDLAPESATRPLLVDHIPSFLDEVIAELAPGDRLRTSLDAIESSPTARRHGEQRWALGYDLQALVREYGVLRHCLLQMTKEAAIAVSIDEFDVLSRCFNVGIAEAAAEHVRRTEGQVTAQRANLEFLGEAGQLLSSSLDYRSTLRRLTGLVVPRMADWCAIHLEGVPANEMAIAHVDPAKREILRDLYARFPPPEGLPRGHLHVVRTGEAELVENVDPSFFPLIAESEEQLSLLRAIGTCSFMIVPLTVQENVFGALMLAYGDSQRRYGPDDLVLAKEVARRAAVAIDNAKLYELSQSERSRVEAATRAKDEFVAMVSHELRTPLNAILGWLRLMRNGSLPPSKREHAFDVIERNAEAQGQLVADLLDISRIITGKIRITPSQVDLGDVIEMAIEGVRPAADAKRIRIDVTIAREDTVMRGDGDRLQQVVWNLLANAVKFTGKNGVIRVGVKRVESDLELVVQDDGIGIPPGFLPHVFESFRQADGSASRPHGGLGIGLSIAKHIVELHGGTIVAESEGIGRGALFRVRLPISPLVSMTRGVSRVPATRERQVDDVAPAGLEGIRVLVVDDEPDARDLVAYVIEGAGMEVRTAGSAAEALAALQTYTPHVIISDIGMPLEDGYSLIRSIRTLSDDEKKNIPAIALTAFARNEDRTRALVGGFNLHMAKPIEPSVLIRAVADLAR